MGFGCCDKEHLRCEVMCTAGVSLPRNASAFAVQVYADLEQTEGVDATFSLAFMEGVHWKKAAALFDTADIVVSPHGAQVKAVHRGRACVYKAFKCSCMPAAGCMHKAHHTK